MTQYNNLNCGFLIFNGFSNMVLASAIEPLRVAQRYSNSQQFSWQIFSIDGEDVTSSSGLTLQCNKSLQQANNVDILFIIAGYKVRHYSDADVIRQLQLSERYISSFGALDSGSWILAAAGMLNNYQATIHWMDINDFAETFLDVKTRNVPYIVDGKRITAGGATAVLDLMLYLIGKIGGGALAFNVANMFFEDRMPKAGIDQGLRNFMLTTRDPQLVRAINIMRANIEQPLSLQEVAANSAMSTRSLSRLFKREFSISPGHYYERIRLDVARNLVEETSLNTSEIAARTGYSSNSSLSRAFRLFYGRTLRELRQENITPFANKNLL